MMQLRPYQTEALENIRKAEARGINKPVLVLPTGGGKTVVFSHLIANKIRQTGKKALVLAHREELLTQAKDKIERVDDTLKVGIEQGELRIATDYIEDVIVASVPTLGRNSSVRKDKFDPRDFCVIVTDEAHHASAATYKNIFRHFGVLKEEPENDWNKELLLLGVTATPNRNDNQGIDKVFDEVVYAVTIIDGIKQKWLSKIKAFRISTHTDISGVKKTAGDFNVGDLQEAINTPERNALIVQTYKDLLLGKQALCFAVDVQHTRDLCQAFRDHGIQAEYVVGETDSEDRKRHLEAFYRKEIPVMVNAMVLTEGYDNEGIDAVLMARPTQSGILYQQMIGRGTRISEGKGWLTIIDFVDNTYRQRLQTTASLLGIEDAVDFKGKDIMSVKEQLEQLKDLAPNVDLSKIDIDKIDRMIEEVDILSGLTIPDEVVNYTNYEWHKFADGVYRIGLGDRDSDKCSMIVEETITGQYDVTGVRWNKITQEEKKKKIFTAPTLDEAIKYSDGVIDSHFSDALALIDSKARWRKDKPTDKQLKMLKKFHVNDTVLNQLDKGQASRLITKLFNMKPQQRSEYASPKLFY